MVAFSHVTVLLREAVEALDVRPDGTYVDCTAGGGGHSAAIAERLGRDGHLVAFDRDPDALAAARARVTAALPDPPPRVTFVGAPFSQLRSALAERDIAAVDGILADLGVSSPQLDRPERGFSFRESGPLDMRMDPTRGPTAADLVASLSEHELADLLFRFGDEKHARRIARAIVARRDEQPITTTDDLAAVVAGAAPKPNPRKQKKAIHPATKTFQALRIAVNGELDELDTLLHDALDLLAPGGRLAVITFHSGEDRPVKQTFAAWARGPELPPEQAVFRSHGDPLVRLPNPKGVEPSDAETTANPRARSARLRIAEKLS